MSYPVERRSFLRLAVTVALTAAVPSLIACGFNAAVVEEEKDVVAFGRGLIINKSPLPIDIDVKRLDELLRNPILARVLPLQQDRAWVFYIPSLAFAQDHSKINSYMERQKDQLEEYLRGRRPLWRALHVYNMARDINADPTKPPSGDTVSTGAIINGKNASIDESWFLHLLGKEMSYRFVALMQTVEPNMNMTYYKKLSPQQQALFNDPPFKVKSLPRSFLIASGIRVGRIANN